MSLRTQAEADLAVSLEASGDFGHPFTLTDPAGFASAEQLYGGVTDIGQVIDPELGIAVTGRHVMLLARISTLIDAGYTGLPEGIADEASAPWIAEFAPLSDPSTPQKYKVKSSAPDETIGVVRLILEFWAVA